MHICAKLFMQPMDAIEFMLAMLAIEFILNTLRNEVEEKLLNIVKTLNIEPIDMKE
jgi:hypothetical protein